MKLPLITKKANGTIFHVLQFLAGDVYDYAVGVEEGATKIKQVELSLLTVLTEKEYKKYKEDHD